MEYQEPASTHRRPQLLFANPDHIYKWVKLIAPHKFRPASECYTQTACHVPWFPHSVASQGKALCITVSPSPALTVAALIQLTRKKLWNPLQSTSSKHIHPDSRISRKGPHSNQIYLQEHQHLPSSASLGKCIRVPLARMQVHKSMLLYHSLTLVTMAEPNPAQRLFLCSQGESRNTGCRLGTQEPALTLSYILLGLCGVRRNYTLAANM
jgi:hypothetical protein